MQFIDLFAGLGGFHLALEELGHTCVFASEIDETLRNLYERNFGLRAQGDITKIESSQIPQHDILCAGFPCQPFSKARKRNGSEDSGGPSELYQQIFRIIKVHQPQYVIMENVPDLLKHNGGGTWADIRRKLENAGYEVADPHILSPHEFEIPQIRKRLYIVASRDSLGEFKWPARSSKRTNIRNILEDSPDGARAISDDVEERLNAWQNFLDRMPKAEKIPLPLWSMEFGATYPFQRTTPRSASLESLRRRRGTHGQRLSAGKTREEVLALLPSHARVEQNRFPRWKINFMKKNRQFYDKHHKWLDEWIEEYKVNEFPSSFQKLEWNCHESDPSRENRKLTNFMIQTRPSGVRVKRTTTAPSLVAMASTQIPIVGWERRYMTLDECMRLQSINKEGFELPSASSRAYSALGNAVNVEVVRLIADSLVGHAPAQEAPTKAAASSAAVDNESNFLNRESRANAA